MTREMRIIVFLFTLFYVKSQIYLYDTNDGLDIQFYDCLLLQSLDYCRRPKQPINLTRDNHSDECQLNGGKLHTFSELRSNDTSVDILIQEWTVTLEQLEQYSLFLKDPAGTDGWICQCLRRGSFGRNCEYQLPVGQTTEETLAWQLKMRHNHSQEVQMYGDVVCYETLECDSGLLCLDWREICDGVQQCLEGRDEENCDILEMNQCDEEEEYRCMNGMCIPEEFFLDGDLDCLDWSDEMLLKLSSKCPQDSVNTECDDRLCLFNQWSCGDGQCIGDQLQFQRLSGDIACRSGRDQYFMCETRLTYRQWTMENGRCGIGDQYESLEVTNRNDEEQCVYLLKCALSQGLEKYCSCYKDSGCAEELDRECHLSLIRYPRGAVVTPFTFFLFNRTRIWTNHRPDWIEINGTVRCRDVLITVREKRIPFDNNFDARRTIEEHFCQPFLSKNISSSTSMLPTRHSCHNVNESSDLCQDWNLCLSNTRIRDGLSNCVNGRDELEQTEMEIEKNCARVRRHRLRCSREQPTCLSVMTLGSRSSQCLNGFDELMFGVGRMISSLRCHNEIQDECSLLRQYFRQSTTNKDDRQTRTRLPFRSHCDTFFDLQGREDENLLECQRWWVCPADQQRCRTGQCLGQSWVNDSEWDCPDASDEHRLLDRITQLTLERASQYDFTNQSFFIPSSCPSQSSPYLCLSSLAIQRGLSCFNLSQLGDGNIDCAGGIDERNTLQHCSQSSSSISTLDFLCSSTNSCIPLYLHCWKDEYRCPNRSDDEFWCEREHRPSNCFDVNDFVCFDGRCAKRGRCDRYIQCLFGEDEYMCDSESSFYRFLHPYREWKRLSPERRSSILHLSLSPSDMNISHPHPPLTSPLAPAMNSLSDSLSPYWCNRGVGVVSTNNHSTILCFCPPHYYGEKCSYHADRLSVVLHLDLSKSIQIDRNDRRILLKLVVVYLFNDDRVLNIDQFHLHPSRQFDSLLNNWKNKKMKFITHFVSPRSSTFLPDRRERFFNRSSLLTQSPFSIRVELYQTRLNEQPSLIGLWKYPLSFSHLPVSRLARVLHFTSSSTHQSPCLLNPCPFNARSHVEKTAKKSD